MRALLREGWYSAWSQPVASVLTLVMVAGMCVAVLATTGRTAAAERAALSQIDAAGTRTVTVRASEESGLDASVIERVMRITQVESVAAFGPLFDVCNSAVEGAPRVAVRPVYSGIETPGGQGRVYASQAGAQALGLLDGVGDVVTDGGAHLTVAGGDVEVPEHLRELEPLVVQPADTGPGAPVAMLVVLAREPAQVRAVADTVAGLLGASDPQSVTIETSERLAVVRDAVQGELGTYGRETVLGILGVAGLLVAANLFGLVHMRRKDFGRRRALGASQGLVVALLLVQTGTLAVIGAVVGVLGSVTVLAASGLPVPSATFTAAVAVAAVLTAVVAAVLPAVVAARRDPLHELRVP